MNEKRVFLTKHSPEYWRVTLNHPPLNIFGPKTIPQLNECITAIETDKDVKVVVFDTAIEGFFLTHYDFLAKIEDTTSLPPGPTGSQLYDFVDVLATRIASFDKRAMSETKRFVDVASLPPDYELAPEWDVCLASIMRPAAQKRISMLMERGFHKPGDVETRLGYHVGQLGAAN